jgi:trimeric autotransporter adhesin
MNRFALYSTFVLSAIAASLITSDLDIQSVRRRVLSTNDDRRSTPTSNSANTRNREEDTVLRRPSEKRLTSKQSNLKSSKASSQNIHGLRGLKSGTSTTPQDVKVDAAAAAVAPRSKSITTKANVMSIDIPSEISDETSQVKSKNKISRQQQSEGSEEKLSSSNIQRKAKSGSVSKKKDDSSVVKKDQDNEQVDISTNDNLDDSKEKRDLTLERENENENETTRPAAKKSTMSLATETKDTRNSKGTTTTTTTTARKVATIPQNDSSKDTEDESENQELRHGGRAMSLKKSSQSKNTKESKDDDNNNNNNNNNNSNNNQSMKKQSPKRVVSVMASKRQLEKSIETRKKKNEEDHGTDPTTEQDSGTQPSEPEHEEDISIESTPTTSTTTTSTTTTTTITATETETENNEEEEEESSSSSSSSSLFSLADSSEILPGQDKVDEMVKQFRGNVESHEVTNKHTEKERYYRLMYGRSKPVKSAW